MTRAITRYISSIIISNHYLNSGLIRLSSLHFSLNSAQIFIEIGYTVVTSQEDDKNVILKKQAESLCSLSRWLWGNNSAQFKTKQTGAVFSQDVCDNCTELTRILLFMTQNQKNAFEICLFLLYALTEVENDFDTVLFECYSRPIRTIYLNSPPPPQKKKKKKNYEIDFSAPTFFFFH